jgi:hypothetical protein
MSDDILRYLSNKIQEELKVIENDMVLGKADSLDAYKYACGIYRGLLVANGLISELAQRMDLDDE